MGFTATGKYEGDPVYKVDRVFYTYAARTARRAMTSALPKKSRASLLSTNDKRVGGAIRLLAAVWQRRVHELSNADWVRFACRRGDERKRHALDCPPTSVRCSRVFGQGCQLGMVCPFCWARRYAITPYRKFEYAAKINRDLDKLELDTVIITNAILLSRDDYQPEQAIRLATMERSDYVLRYLSNAYGAYSLAFAEGYENPRLLLGRFWRVQSRIVALAPPELARSLPHSPCVFLPPFRRRRLEEFNTAVIRPRRIRIHTGTSKWAIARAVGVLGSYPSTRMYSPLSSVLPFISGGLRSPHQVATFGALKNDGARLLDVDDDGGD